MPVAGELTLHLPPVALKHQQFISGFISWVCGFSLQVLLLPLCEQLFRKLYNRDFQDGGGEEGCTSLGASSGTEGIQGLSSAFSHFFLKSVANRFTFLCCCFCCFYLCVHFAERPLALTLHTQDQTKKRVSSFLYTSH